MKKLFFSALVLLTGQLVFAQGYEVEFLIQDLPDEMVYLSRYSKKEFVLIDSIQAVNGTFYFHRSEDQPRAMCRMSLKRPGAMNVQDNSGYIEFIWANESFRVFADSKNISETVSFDNSKENSAMGEFRQYEIAYENKMSALYPLIDRYPEKDEFYREASAHFVALQKERDAVIQNIINQNKELFVSKIIASYRSSILKPELKGQERMLFLQQYFFDKSLINQPELLNAPVYGMKIIDYLKLYGNQNLSFGDQENAFMQAVDVIMANVSGDPELRSFVVEYLLEGFQSFGMEKIQTYIVDTYVDETCETDAVDLAVERVTAYRKMAEGEIAKDIFIRSRENTMVRLSEVESEYTLVIFWATYCKHCKELIPQIGKWYNNERPDNLEVFSVSIDTLKSAWDEFNELVDPQWINTFEPRGWEGKSAVDYNIYATPTMFLLDKQRRIIAKPYTFRELMREVGKLREAGSK
ncbi:thioredoxin-like domain-containing protein [Bacteroidota bacterium]